MAIVRSICADACQKIGMSNPNLGQLKKALTALNDLLDSDSTNSLLIYDNPKETFSLVATQSDYTWGSGGDITTTRPIRITDMFIRDLNGIDIQVHPMTSVQYNDIPDKDVSNRPHYYYYKPEFPLGIIKFNYAPSIVETVHVKSWKELTAFASLSTTFEYPPGYKRYWKLKLAVELITTFGAPIDNLLIKQFTDAENDLENLNAGNKVEPVKLPYILVGRGHYNILTGEWS